MVKKSKKSLSGFFAYPHKPHSIAQTIRNALSKLGQQASRVEITPWEALDTPGRFMAVEIEAAIDSSDFLVADISQLNFNVTYEVGFAIGRDRRVLLVRDRAISKDWRRIDSLGIYDTVGHREYENSAELAKFISGVSDVRPLSTNRPINRQQPVYLLHTKIKRDHPLRVVSRLKTAGLGFRTFDPVEQSRLSCPEAIEQVSQSCGIVVQLVPHFVDDSSEHNLRGAFLAGLAAGMGKEYIILQEGEDPVPKDYRDIAKPCTRLEDVDEAISTFAGRVVREVLTTDTSRPSLPATLLARIDLGASSAENEFRDLHEYYHETDTYRRARRGEARLIVGRKGAGKTAIFFQLRDELRRDRRSLILDMKPEGYKLRKFKEIVLNSLKEGSAEHTIVSFWNLVLVHQITHQILENDRVLHTRDHKLYEDYRTLENTFFDRYEIYEGDFSERISRLIDRIASDYQSKHGGKTDVTLSTPEVTELIYQADIRPLEDTLFRYLRHKRELWMLFDNLDKGWPAHGLTSDDVLLIRGLLEATRKVEHSCQQRNIDAHTLIFLRNDVYEFLVEETPDRGKESRLVIDWDDPEQLKEILRRRLVRDIDGNPDFQTVWRRICAPLVHGEESSSYLVRRSLMRPRFFLDLIKQCKSYAINLNHSHISGDDIEKGLKSFSNGLIRDIEHEIETVYPAAKDIVFAFIDSEPRLSLDEILAKAAAWKVPIHEMTDLLDTLLWYGFLGLVDSSGNCIYIYDVNYNMSNLLGRQRRMAQLKLTYEINPAFWPGLEIRPDKSRD